MIGVMNYFILFSYFFNSQCREDYKRSFLAQLSSPNSSASLSSYLDAHNAYVTQLHATNGMVDQYNQYVLPQLLQVATSPDHVETIFFTIYFNYCTGIRRRVYGFVPVSVRRGSPRI